MPNIAAPTLHGQLHADFMHSPLKQVGASLLFRVAGNLAQSFIQDPSLKSNFSLAMSIGSLLATAAAMESVKTAFLEPSTSFESTTDRLLHIATTAATAAVTHINGGAAAGELIHPDMKPIVKLGMEGYAWLTGAQIANGFIARMHEANDARQAAARAQ